jgi:ribonuclease R
MVHRALIASLSLGEGGQEMLTMPALKMIGDHISATERTAAQLEREVMDRYLVLFLENRVGEIFKGTIVGVTAIGIFVSLDESGAQGFIHKARLPGDYYELDPVHHRYMGRRTKRFFQLGDTVSIRLEGADARTSSTSFMLEEDKMSYPNSSKKPLKKLTEPKPRNPKTLKKKAVKKKRRRHKKPPPIE